MSVVTLASVLAQEEVDPFEALAEVIPGEPGRSPGGHMEVIRSPAGPQ